MRNAACVSRSPFSLSRVPFLLGLLTAVVVLCSALPPQLSAFPIITSVVETGGDNEATDTVTAKWTGVTFSNGIAGEFLNPFTVPPFGVLAPALVDRTHAYTNVSGTVGIPGYLLGGEYIMSGNDNRDNAGYLLDVTISQAAQVFLLIDNRLGDTDGNTPPTFDATHMQWVLDQGWTPVINGLNHLGSTTTPDEVGLDESADGTINQWFAVYTKTFPAGTFQLKQADNAGQNMYGAVVVPVPNPFPNFVNVGGNPVGTVSTDSSSGAITIVGGGNDIWDMGDEFSYAYTKKTGDFDVKVRVASLSPTARWSKAGLMVRESLAEDSRMVFLRVTPGDVATGNGGNGANDTKLSYRTGNFANQTDGDPGENDGRHEDPADQNAPPYPNAWLRLVRAGNVFSGSISSDGTTWTPLTSQDTSAGGWSTGGGAFKNDVLLGLAVSRHSAGTTATAEFRDVGFTPTTFALAQADSRGNPNGVLVTYTQVPDANGAATDPASYNLADGGGNTVTISSVTAGPRSGTYWLNTAAPLTEGTTYTVIVFASGVVAGGVNLAVDTQSFTHGAGYEARPIHVGHNKGRENGDVAQNRTSYKRRLFAMADGEAAIEAGKLDGGVSYFEEPLPDNGSNERYIGEIFGILNVTTAGSYKFAVSSDDIGNLFLSSDTDPAHKVAIAREPEWNGSRQYAVPDRRPTQQNISPNIALSVGRYYLEYTYAEGGGGNNASATWQPPGAPAIANNQLPIAASAFAPSRYYNGGDRGVLFNSLGPVTVVTPPLAQTVTALQPVTFSAQIDGTPAYSYQWRRDGTPIAGANEPSYTIPVTLPSDEGAVFSLVVNNEFSTATSAGAKLTIINPVPPKVLSAKAQQYNNTVVVKFDNRLQASSAQNTANYSIAGVTVTGAVLDANGTMVTLTVNALAEGATYNLVVKDVKDLTGINSLTPNPTTVAFHTSTFIPGFVKKEVYSGYTSGLDALIANSALLENPSITCYRDLWEINTADEFDNYGGRLSGFFIATETGPHIFYIATDDPGKLFLSTDSDPAHKVQIANDPVWAARREWTGEASGGGRGTPPSNISAPINLVAGQKYYMESLFVEGGGGDHMEVAVQLPSDAAAPVNGSTPITPANMGSYVDLNGASLTIGTQPADVTLAENGFATFTVAINAVNAPCPTTYQWYRDGVAIAGAVTATYKLGPLTQLDDTSAFSVVVKAPGLSVTSRDAILHVLPAQPLKVVKAFGSRSLTNLTVVFDQLVDPVSVGDFLNYSVAGFEVKTASVNSDNISVLLSVDHPMEPGKEYCVTMSGLFSALLLEQSPATITTCFTSYIVSCGYAVQEIYSNISGVNVSDLLGAAAYPNSPDMVRYKSSLEANTADEFDNYGTRISGFIVPPVSGNYTFYMASDDGGEFWLSTDSSPANLVQVAREPVWAARRNFAGEADGGGRGTPPANVSVPIALVAGQFYYYEALMKEGGGGDNLAVTWQMPGQAAPNDGAAPIPAAFLAILADPTGASVNITSQPADTTVAIVTGGATPAATFTVVANTASPASPGVAPFYLWEKNSGSGFTAIDGANGPSLTFTPRLTDNGLKVRVRVYVPGASAISTAATLTVVQPNTAPQFVCGPNQAVNEDSGAQSVAWATGIQPSSVVRTPIVYGSTFDVAPQGSTVAGSGGLGSGTIGSGVFRMTMAENSAWGVFYTPKVSQFVESYTVDFSAYLGGGTCCGDPLTGNKTSAADGFSVNIADNLPVPGYGSPGEDGGGTGLSVNFDTWDNAAAGTPSEAPSIELKWQGNVLASYFPPVHLSQGGNPVRFIPVHVAVTADGKATVNYDGTNLFNQVVLPGWAPTANLQVGFGARTGGANDNQWIDDLNIVALSPDASSAEAGQTVSFLVSNDQPSLFAVQPAVSPTGTLTYTPAANAHGTAHVTVVAKDNGGTEFGGQDTSAPCSFDLVINAVNDCPTADSSSQVVDAGGSVSFDLTGTDPDGDALQFTVTQAPVHGVVVVNVATGHATYSPSAGYAGPDSLQFTVKDGVCESTPATVTINVRVSNRPPVAKITTEGLADFSPASANKLLISNNGTNACLGLSGALSSDPDGDAIVLYQWFDEPSPLAFATGVTVHECLDLGQHTIILVVTDARGATGSDQVTFEVVDASDAIDLLIEDINNSTIARGNKRPFIATLKAASAAADRGSNGAAANQLHALQNKLRAQVAKSNPAEAARWIAWAQSIIDALNQ